MIQITQNIRAENLLAALRQPETRLAVAEMDKLFSTALNAGGIEQVRQALLGLLSGPAWRCESAAFVLAAAIGLAHESGTLSDAITSLTPLTPGESA